MNIENPEIQAIIQSFEPDSKKPKERYSEFLAYCYYNLDKMINIIHTNEEKIKQMTMDGFMEGDNYNV